MRIIRFSVLFLVAGVLAWAWTPAQAHAMLMRSVPNPNATLAASPGRVELFFSETAAPTLSTIKVLDAQGVQMNSVAASLDPTDATHLMVSLPTLPDGVYLVVWRVISATDGHQTSGSFPFAVGNAAPGSMTMAAGQMTAPGAPSPVADMLMKGLLYLAASTLVGGILFSLLVWNPSMRKTEITSVRMQGYSRFSQKLALGALLTLAIADVLSLMVQAGMARNSLIGWPWQPEFAALLTATRVGSLGIARLVAAALLAGLLLPAQNRWNRWAGLAVCLVLLLTFSLESHAAGYPQPLLPVLADWLHLTAVSVWVGGLFSFLGAMLLTRKLSPERRTVLTSHLIPHFTVLAMASVGVLGLTGVYAAYLDIGRLDSLWTTTYGQALIVKLAIAAPMLALGGINFLFTTPIMKKAASKPGGSVTLVRRFRQMLTGESILGVFILLWVGAFTTLPPASMTASQPSGISQSTQADDLTIVLLIDPGQPGLNTFTATITSAGKPVTNAQDVSLEFTSLSNIVPPSKAAMASLGNGKYTLQGGYLGLPDKWDIKVVVIRPGKFDAYGDFKFDVSQSAGMSMR